MSTPLTKKQVVDFTNRLAEPGKPASPAAVPRPRLALEHAFVQQRPLTEWLGERIEQQQVSVSPHRGADGLLEELASVLKQYGSARLSAILRTEKYKTVHGAWEDVSRAVNNPEFPRTGRLFLKPATKEQVLDDARTAGRDIENSTLNTQLVRNHFNVAGGKPLLTVRWTFPVAHTSDDLELLRFAGSLGRLGHFVNLFDAAPALLGLVRWRELPRNTTDIRNWFDSAELKAFKGLQQENFAPYVAIFLPGLVGRKPYGAGKKAPGAGWFEEQVRDPDELPLTSAAAAMGRCIAASMGRHNFPGSVIGANHGGLVRGVALITAADLAGAPARNSPTPVIIDDLMEKAFDDNHLLSLVPIKESDAAAFFSSETLYTPLVFEDPQRSADAAQLSKLPHVLIASRWAHYLQLKLRAILGSQQSAREVERQLQQWADRWVLTQPEGTSEALKARQPLRDIKITVFDIPGQPGHLDARAELQPHYRVASFKAVLILKGGSAPAKPSSST